MNSNLSDFVVNKLTSAITRGYFRTIDLFAGCGGMSLGFHRAGFHCVSAIEIDDLARSSHQYNFSKLAPVEGYKAYSDITITPPPRAVAHIGTVPLEDTVDVVIGGPPCQPFSSLGRAALWRIAGHERAHADDKRATLYHHFLEYIAELLPLVFIMENVPEIGKFAGRNVAEEIAITADGLGYETRYAVLNAIWYGVPQLRERMIIIGVRKELGITPGFPKIEFEYDIPKGYATSTVGPRKTTLPPQDHFVQGIESLITLKPAVTVATALSDLPPITHHLDGKSRKGIQRDINRLVPYTDTCTTYSLEMRQWPGYYSNGHTSGHVIRYTPRDYEIFRRMPPQAMYPQALEIAQTIFREKLEAYEQQHGHKLVENSEEWLRLKKETVPPYKEHRFPNKYRKMAADKPSHTLPAHLSKDSYSHIHYDSEQARGISLREAARLQSFPDAYTLVGGMGSQLRQIGNAVPPLMAYAIARQVRQDLELFLQRSME